MIIGVESDRAEAWPAIRQEYRKPLRMDIGQGDLRYRGISEKAPGRSPALKASSEHQHFHDQATSPLLLARAQLEI